MAHLLSDLRYALRSFGKSPVFTVVALISLALGIGANTAIFTLMDQVLLRALPLKDPDQLVLLSWVGSHYGSNTGNNALSYPMYRDFRDRNQVFSGMLCRFAVAFSMNHSGQTERIAGEFVSGNYYELLGVKAAVGRLISLEDDRLPGHGAVAVLSHSYWQNRFDSDPNIVGQTIRLNGFPMTIIGVVEPRFHGVDLGFNPQVMAPVGMTKSLMPTFDNLEQRRQRWVQVFGRLKPGISIEQAKASLQPIFKSILNMEVQQSAFSRATKYTKDRFLAATMDLLPGAQGRPQFRARFQAPLVVLMCVVGMVLLIACANVANLSLARATSRQKEMAVRLAMGAKRTRIIGQLLTESVLLSLLGGIAGLVFAVWLDRYLLSVLPQGSSPLAIRALPDMRVFAFTFGIAVLTGMIFGLAPAFQGAKTELAHTLKDQAGSVTGTGALRLRKSLVVTQVTLSLLLLIGSGLFIRSLQNLRSLDPGFRPTRLLSLSLDPMQIGYEKPRAREFWIQLYQTVSALPGVENVALSRVRLLDGNRSDSSVTVAGYRAKDGEDMNPWVNAISPGYFATLGIPLVDGREFRFSDQRSMVLEQIDWTAPGGRDKIEQAEAKVTGSPKYAVVNEKFARYYFGDKSAVGQRFGWGIDPGTKTNIEIVGVVKDTMYGTLREAIPRQVFTPFLQNDYPAGMNMYVRTKLEPEPMFRSIRQTVKNLDAALPVYDMRTVEEQIDRSLVTERMIAMLSAVFGVVATLLAMVGLYGVMAYTVARRTREIGIRIALGAFGKDVIWMVMREVLLMIALGTLIGVPAALGLTRYVQTQLYGLSPADPLTFLAATFALIAVAVLAGYIPALRASRIDPLRALRYE